MQKMKTEEGEMTINDVSFPAGEQAEGQLLWPGLLPAIAACVDPPPLSGVCCFVGGLAMITLVWHRSQHHLRPF
jgi:hypothetical protein